MEKMSFEAFIKNIPMDDLMASALQAAQEQQNRKCAKSERPTCPDKGIKHPSAEQAYMENVAQKGAETIKKQYDQYLAVGFTVEQATQFIVAILNK